MQKPAETPFDLHEIIRQRWSPVAFDPRPIPAEVLGSLFEAARWAPSSYNEQPWCYCVATQAQPTEFAALLGCLMDANQVWAKQAGALVISCAQLAYQRNQKPNRHAWHDVGLATQNLLLQATARGLIGHPMGGFDPLRAREVLQIPDTHEPVAAIALGYPLTDCSAVPDDLRQRDESARVRKPLTDMVFTGRWGKFAGPFLP